MAVVTLPDCMMPDGADPCRGYQELRERAERAEAERPLLQMRDELLAENEALRALLREARDDWIKVGYGASHEDVAACRDFCDRIDNMIGGSK